MATPSASSSQQQRLAPSAPHGPISTHLVSYPNLASACVPQYLPAPRIDPLLKLMSSEGRSRRRELVEEAYKLQMKAGLMARRIHLCPSSFAHPSPLLSLRIHLSFNPRRS